MSEEFGLGQRGLIQLDQTTLVLSYILLWDSSPVLLALMSQRWALATPGMMGNDITRYRLAVHIKHIEHI